MVANEIHYGYALCEAVWLGLDALFSPLVNTVATIFLSVNFEVLQCSFHCVSHPLLAKFPEDYLVA